MLGIILCNKAARKGLVNTPVSKWPDARSLPAVVIHNARCLRWCFYGPLAAGLITIGVAALAGNANSSAKRAGF